MLESYGYDPNMTNEELAYQLLKSMKENENRTEEELRNMSVELGAFLDDFFGDFDNLTAGDVNAKYNWWALTQSLRIPNSRIIKAKLSMIHGLH